MPNEGDGQADGVEESGAGSNRKRVHILQIVGIIEGQEVLDAPVKSTNFEQVLPELVAVEELEEVGGLLVLLHTEGGDVDAALAIAEAIASMAKPTVSLTIGNAHSMGLPLAVAAKLSFIAPSAEIMIHPAWAQRIVRGFAQEQGEMQKVQDRIRDFVCGHSHVSPEKYASLRDSRDGRVAEPGTLLSGPGAVECGLIDQVGGLKEALAALHHFMDEGRTG